MSVIFFIISQFDNAIGTLHFKEKNETILLRDINQGDHPNYIDIIFFVMYELLWLPLRSPVCDVSLIDGTSAGNQTPLQLADCASADSTTP